MKIKLLYTAIILCNFLLPSGTICQGVFQVRDTEAAVTALIADAPTRIGGVNGPLAGDNILAILLAGLPGDSLQPVGVPYPHSLYEDGNPSGVVLISEAIPFIPRLADGFIQVAVWDGSVWGRDFNDVPGNQLGYTEIRELPPIVIVVPMVRFQQAAIVPAIPEPRVCALIGAGGLMLLM
jgi:hypothetical protein